MVDRTTKVTLTAQVSNYLSSMDQVNKKNHETVLGAGQLKEKLEQQHAAMSTVGTGLLAVGAVAAVGIGMAVKAFAEFDQAMSEVQASTHASEEDMGKLRDAAVRAGADTQYSATEAANAIDELSKAGVSTADVLGGALSGSLSLAAAGSVDVASAASIAATALTQFKLKGADVPHVADLLAAGAGKAQGSVTDLAGALNQGGLVASQAGFKIEETTGVLAAFASAGLLGSDAGTSLKTAILALESPSTQAAGIMKKYGINVYDANGRMASFSGIAGQLKSKLGGLSDEQRNAALATIFGTDAVRSAGVLYQQGAKGIQDWTDKVNDTGYAATTARLKMDNLSGDLEFLKGSFDTVLIQSGSAANDSLRGLVQTASGLVNAIGNLPQPVINAGVALGGLTSVVGLVGGGALTIIPKVAAMKKALDALKVSGKGAAIGIGAVSLAVGALVLVLGAVAEAQANAASKTAAYGETLDAVTHGATANTRALTVANLAVKDSFLGIEGDSGYDAAKKLGLGLDLVTDAASGNVEALEKVDAYLRLETTNHAAYEAALKKSGLSADQFTIAGLAVDSAVRGESSSIKEAIRVAKQKAEADSTSADSSKAVADSLDDVTVAATDTTGEMKTLVDALKNYGSAALTARAGARQFEAALDDASASIKKNKKNLDIHTEAGRANQTALDAIATSTNNLASETYAQAGSVSQTTKVLNEGRKAYIETAVQMGMTRAAAARLADRLLATPKAIRTSVQLSGVAKALSDLDVLTRKIRAMPSSVGLSVDVKGNVAYSDSRNSKGDGKAGGGTVGGSGPGKGDTVFTRLSVGEEVIQNPQASMYRSLLKDINAGTYSAASYSAATPQAPRIVQPIVNIVSPTVVSAAEGARQASQVLLETMGAD